MRCGVVWCGARLLAVRCGYAILRAVWVQFLRFMWFMQFGEHPYSQQKGTRTRSQPFGSFFSLFGRQSESFLMMLP